jgi:hypothetical protein
VPMARHDLFRYGRCLPQSMLLPFLTAQSPNILTLNSNQRLPILNSVL